MLKYEKLVLGEMQTNCYLVWEEESREVMIIDPADEGVEIAQEIQEKGLKPIVVVGTHGHFDHLLGALDLMLIFNIPLALSELDEFLVNRMGETAEHFLGHKIKVPKIEGIDINLDRAISIRLGEEKLMVIKTPGHTPGSVCFYSAKNKLIFTGDTLFAEGFIGETSHKYSSMLEIRKSVKKITELPGDTLLLPGHGAEDMVKNCRGILRLE